MKNTISALLFMSFIGSGLMADVYVNGYYKKDGTYVAPHYRSNPNGYKHDNWSTKGNRNPYTGKYGSKSPYDY
ncbi:hypothetical protein [Campylobacter sp. RKI_CA19_01116]|uniref:hypothetical protein n=1 Tax=Campylobacter sp. RKI_CA19_01116 TaxID=2911625 RepID=UPI0017C4A101|nr:hypothetical protein [Campylobacter sp. RKI_CA19_01116]EAI5466740.1 hypothetical protein [Campylobacter lari]MCV3397317.1 hypothetical protein [Campylobacter sp. RKI_CA19_01116]